MRIAIGAFMYEANSFSPVQTTLDDFAAGTLVRGAAMLDYFRDTNTEVAGFPALLRRATGCRGRPAAGGGCQPGGTGPGRDLRRPARRATGPPGTGTAHRAARRGPAGATRRDGRRRRGRPRRRRLSGRARYRWAGGAYRGLARPARQRHRAHGRGGGRARRLPDLSPRGSAADRRAGGGAGAGRGAGWPAAADRRAESPAHRAGRDDADHARPHARGARRGRLAGSRGRRARRLRLRDAAVARPPGGRGQYRRRRHGG